MNNSKKIFILAGEASGDLHASELVKNIKDRDNEIKFSGIGGNHLKSEGVELIYDYNHINYIGFFSIIKYYFSIKKYFNTAVQNIRTINPEVIILVDFPGFNLKICKEIRKFFKGKIIYYISPQLWAWHKSRVKIIRKYVDKMLVIFPFEVDFYKNEGIDASFVGHPLIKRLSRFQHRTDTEPGKPQISVLPGSRKEEIKFMLPVLSETAKQLSEKYGAKIKIICAANIDIGFLKSIIPGSDFDFVKVSENNETINYETIINSDLVISKSGTSTLECCLLETPFCVVYKTNYFNYFIGKSLIKVKFLSIVNILAGKEIVKEFLQKDFNAKNLLDEVAQLIVDKEYRDNMIKEFRNIKKSLSKINITKDASEIICDLMK